jgi:hypothetical protein
MLDHERIRHSRRTLLGVLLLSALPWSVFLLAGVDYYPLDADHILVSRGWCGDGAGQVALPGSDHRGVLATVGPCLPAATP